jgi:hypothetical protein
VNLSDIAPDIVAPLTQEGYKYEPFVAILPFETNWCINYMSTALKQGFDIDVSDMTQPKLEQH